nr:hypothetical protein [Actinomycetota bacterium]
ELAALAEVARPGSGVVLVAEGPIPGAVWRLAAVEDGYARLEPLGLDVRVAGLAGALETNVGDLDEDAIAAAAGLLAAASHDEDVAPLVEITAEPPRRARPPRRRDHDVWVKVLGPVEICGWAKPVGSRRKYEEVVAYLATHEGPVRGERLRAAVWPETDLDPKSFREAISRVRAHLGREARHLPEARAGAYHLADSVGCDWAWFQALSAAAARSSPSEAMALWREALELVRGEPFGGGLEEARPYLWAYSELLVYEMQVAITKAADALAELALAHDDPEMALWATGQGHLATPSQLSLFDWQMRAAAHRGDRDGLNLAFRSRRQVEQSLDAGADVPPEVVELYERLQREIMANSHAGAASRP